MSLYGFPKSGSSSMACLHSSVASSRRPRYESAHPRKVWPSAVGLTAMLCSNKLDGVFHLPFAQALGSLFPQFARSLVVCHV